MYGKNALKFHGVGRRYAHSARVWKRARAAPTVNLIQSKIISFTHSLIFDLKHYTRFLFYCVKAKQQYKL